MRRILALVLVACCMPAARGATPAVSAGAFHSLALHADGTLRSWGDDSSGALGIGRTLISATPTAIGNLSNVVAVSAGGNHTVALKRDGTVWTWGSNEYGELGDGTTTAR